MTAGCQILRSKIDVKTKMNTRKILEISLHLIRFLLLIISLLALATIYVWVFNLALVKKADTAIIANYIDKSKLQLREANKFIAKDKNEDAIKSLKNLLEKLKDIKKKDRLAPIKQDVLNNIVQVYIKRNDLDQALKWVNACLIFDDRDLVAQVERAKILNKIPERQFESINILQKICDKVPTFSAAVNAYVDILIDNKRNTEAYLIAYKYASALETKIDDREWEIFWDTGRNFNASQKRKVNPTWDTSGYLNISVTIPKGNIKRFRVDSPAWMKLRIMDAAFNFADSVQQSSLLLKNVIVRSHDIISSEKGVLVTDGIDPYFYFDVPKGMGMNGEVKVVFRAKVSIALPHRLNVLLNDTKAVEKIVNDLLDKKKNMEAFIAYSWRAASFESQIAKRSWEIFWDTGENFNASQKKKVNPTWDAGGYLNISTTIPAGKIKQFRIDSPGRMSLQIMDAAIDFTDRLHQSSLLLKNVVLGGNDIIESDNGILLTDGIDPYFYFDVPTEFGTNGEVNVEFRAKVSRPIPERLKILLTDSSTKSQIMKDLIKIGKVEAAAWLDTDINSFGIEFKK